MQESLESKVKSTGLFRRVAFIASSVLAGLGFCNYKTSEVVAEERSPVVSFESPSPSVPDILEPKLSDVDKRSLFIESVYRFSDDESESSKCENIFSEMCSLLGIDSDYSKLRYAMFLDAQDGCSDNVINPKLLERVSGPVFVAVQGYQSEHSGKEPYFCVTSRLVFKDAKSRDSFYESAKKFSMSKALIVSHSENFAGDDGVYNKWEVDELFEYLTGMLNDAPKFKDSISRMVKRESELTHQGWRKVDVKSPSLYSPADSRDKIDSSD